MSSRTPGASGLPHAVFLDRDGTVIRDTGYLSDPMDVELVPGAAEAIRTLNDLGVPVVIVTNQSGIGRGCYDEAAFRSVQAETSRLLAERGAHTDAVFHCPHAPGEGCSCRKPGLGMYERAARELGVELSRCWYVGDRPSDVLPAAATGGTPLLVAGTGGGYDDPVPPGCARAPDLLTGIRRLLEASVGGGDLGPDG